MRMRKDSNSADYYRQREAHERELAEKANLPNVRQIHLSLAKRYRALAENADELETGFRDGRSNKDADAPRQF